MSPPTAPDYSPEDFADFGQDDYPELDSALDDYNEARGQFGSVPVSHFAMPSELPSDLPIDDGEMWKGDQRTMTFLDRCFGRGSRFADVMERFK
jgi:hypothetical protein